MQKNKKFEILPEFGQNISVKGANLWYGEFQAIKDIGTDSSYDICTFCLEEFLACDSFVKLNVSVGYAFHNLRSHFRNLLTCLTLETIVHQPLTNELL